jgi:hypothetical protein
MHASDWASVVSGGVAVVSAIGAGIGWLLARKEKRAAGRHACEALKAARDAADAEARTANALERSADVDEAQAQRAAELSEAEEESPWDLLPIRGSHNCELVNRTARPKYHLLIAGPAMPPPGVGRPEVPARGRVEVNIPRLWRPDMQVKVSWYTTKDRSDGGRSRNYDVPSRIG